MGGSLVDGVPVVSKESLFASGQSDNEFVFIWTVNFEGNSQEKMISELYKEGIFHWYNITLEDRNQICHPLNHDHEQFYKENRNLILHVLESLYDEQSVEEYIEYMRTYIENSTWRLKEADTVCKYFFGGQGDKREKIYMHLDDEVWLNCGCHVGDTIFNFYRNGLKAKRIIAIDDDEYNIRMIRDNLTYLKNEDQETVKVMCTHIDKDMDWLQVLNGDKLTLINADIEP